MAFDRIRITFTGNPESPDNTTFSYGGYGTISLSWSSYHGATTEDTIHNAKSYIDANFPYYLTDSSSTTLDVYFKSNNTTEKSVWVLDNNDSSDLYTNISEQSILPNEFDPNSIPEETKPTEPYFQISEANPISYSVNQEWDDKYMYKNIFNTKSCQENVPLAYKITHRHDTYDPVLTQFWTNYDNIEVNQIANGVNTELPYVQRIQNIGLKYSYDCNSYRIDDDYVGVYFESGDTYDFDTDEVNGDYDLSGLLPNNVKIGDYVYTYSYGWKPIVNIIYDDSLQADVLVLEAEFNFAFDDVIRIVYDRAKYNVYEFMLDLESLDNKINVSIICTDDREDFSDVLYYSEDIEKIYENDKLIEIIYFNFVNSSNIEYSTKFFGITRLKYDVFEELNDSKVEINKTDDTSVSTSSYNYHGKKLVLKDLPTRTIRQVTEIFSHKEIYINRIKYTVSKIGDAERLGDSNLYTIEIELIEAESYYNPLQKRWMIGDRVAVVDGLLQANLQYEI